MLPKHPDRLSDDELRQWIHHLVNEGVEEGPRLDYKAELPLASGTDRREAAKDISSFANEIGGTLLYGIPEDRAGESAPRPTIPYGIGPIQGIEQRLENLYIDAIRPTLPEWRIRPVEMSGLGDLVYIVWTPESWLGPHMVEAYGLRRYYRRGQYRAVEMAEHEVRGRFERLTRTQDIVRTIVTELERESFAIQYDDPCGSHYLAYPLTLPYERADFSSSKMRSWLFSHPYPPDHWIPSVLGVQTPLVLGEPSRTRPGAGPPWLPYAQITRRGAVSVWRHTKVNFRPDSDIPDTIQIISEFAEVWIFLQLAAQFLEELEYVGPVRIRLRFNEARGPLQLLSEVDHEPRTFHGPYPLVIEVDAAASDLASNPKPTFKRLADQLARAFGEWEANWVTAAGDLASSFH